MYLYSNGVKYLVNILVEVEFTSFSNQFPYLTKKCRTSPFWISALHLFIGANFHLRGGEEKEEKEKEKKERKKKEKKEKRRFSQ